MLTSQNEGQHLLHGGQEKDIRYFRLQINRRRCYKFVNTLSISTLQLTKLVFLLPRFQREIELEEKRNQLLELENSRVMQLKTQRSRPPRKKRRKNNDE